MKGAEKFVIPRSVYRRSWSPSSFLPYYEAGRSAKLYLSLGLQVCAISDRHTLLADFTPSLPYFKTTGVLTQANSLGGSLVSPKMDSQQLDLWFRFFAPYTRSLIIRGIGYRLYPLVNVDETGSPYNYSRYVYLRAGHSYPTYCGVPNGLGLKTFRRERKIVIFGYKEALVSMFADRLFYYRSPNAFTGRGIRFKRVRYHRKPGKRAQKGRGF